jgi:hypothetical protein
VTTPAGLRDRALIALMVFSFARIGAALAMRVDDVYSQQRRLWVRLHEKGGKRHEMPYQHTLDAYLHAYLDGTGIGGDPKGPLFRTIQRGTGQLSDTALPQANAYAMVRRGALAAGIGTKIGNHTFRATGITAYLKNGGTLENAATMANHASTRTTQLYDRRHDEISLDEVERIRVSGIPRRGDLRTPVVWDIRGSNVADRPMLLKKLLTVFAAWFSGGFSPLTDVRERFVGRYEGHFFRMPSANAVLRFFQQHRPTTVRQLAEQRTF